MNEDSFAEFVIDQLSGVPGLRRKAMFGGHGLYAGDTFFAILMNGRLYLKTDTATRSRYEKLGCAPFHYEKARQTMSIHYYEVPANVLESKELLHEWAGEAIRAGGDRRTPRSKRK